MPNETDKLVDDLRRDGVLVDEGAFTLDRQRAREKLRDFQLAAPQRYLLLLIQAAVLKDATRIDCTVDADGVRLAFDGRIFTRAELDTLYEDPFASDVDRDRQACQKLALGTNVGLGQNLARIEVRSGDERGATSLVLRPGQPDQVRAVDGVDGSEGSRIELRYAGRLGRLHRRWLSVLHSLPQARLIHLGCRFTETAIFVNGERVSAGLHLPSSWDALSIEGRGWRGVVGRVARKGKEGVVLVIRHGVLISAERLGEDASLVAVVEDRALATDLSQFTLVKNEDYDLMVDRVQAAHLRVRRGMGGVAPAKESLGGGVSAGELLESMFPPDRDPEPVLPTARGALMGVYLALISPVMLYFAHSIDLPNAKGQYLAFALLGGCVALALAIGAAVSIRRSRGRRAGANATLGAFLLASPTVAYTLAHLPTIITAVAALFPDR